MYRVIQWATGNVGKAAIEGVLHHPELELVGCWVHSEEKDGTDVGTLIGREPLGVTATRDVDALLALDADCVVYTPIFADGGRRETDPRVGEERRHAARLVLPARRRTRQRMDAVCREAGVTLHGTGIHPGGITERFPLMVSALSDSITARAGRGVLRHPHLRRTRRDPRLDALREDPRGVAHEHHGRGPRRGFRQSVPHGRRRARLPTRPRTPHHPRDGGRDRAHRVADRTDRPRAWSRPSASGGRVWSTADPW